MAPSSHHGKCYTQLMKNDTGMRSLSAPQIIVLSYFQATYEEHQCQQHTKHVAFVDCGRPRWVKFDFGAPIFPMTKALFKSDIPAMMLCERKFLLAGVDFKILAVYWLLWVLRTLSLSLASINCLNSYSCLQQLTKVSQELKDIQFNKPYTKK